MFNQKFKEILNVKEYSLASLTNEPQNINFVHLNKINVAVTLRLDVDAGNLVMEGKKMRRKKSECYFQASVCHFSCQFKEEVVGKMSDENYGNEIAPNILCFLLI